MPRWTACIWWKVSIRSGQIDNPINKNCRPLLSGPRYSKNNIYRPEDGHKEETKQFPHLGKRNHHQFNRKCRKQGKFTCQPNMCSGELESLDLFFMWQIIEGAHQDTTTCSLHLDLFFFNYYLFRKEIQWMLRINLFCELWLLYSNLFIAELSSKGKKPLKSRQKLETISLSVKTGGEFYSIFTILAAPVTFVLFPYIYYPANSYVPKAGILHYQSTLKIYAGSHLAQISDETHHIKRCYLWQYWIR